MALFGRTYPEAGSASAPYLRSLLHTPTRALALAVGRVKTSRSQAADLSREDTLIALSDTDVTLYSLISGSGCLESKPVSNAFPDSTLINGGGCGNILQRCACAVEYRNFLS